MTLIRRKDSSTPLGISHASPTDFKQRKKICQTLNMPGIIIFVHGVNSEGEWYEAAEKHLLAGLNKRLGRDDLQARSYGRENAQPNLESSATSPVIHFYWGYRAPNGQERKWKVPLRDKQRQSAWAKDYTPKPPLYWGGGAFQNGCNSLPLLWSERGFSRRVWAAFIPVDVQGMNPEVDRQLQDAPPRTFYAHAAGRLADLLRKIRGKYPADTITVIGHSQGTQIVLGTLALLEPGNQPDCVMLMNGPYALESKATDSLALGNDAPTEKARRNTFENIVRHFMKGYRPLTDDLIAKLRVGATPERESWTPKLPGERDNTGRIYVYFNPHDRVMGSTALQSIGWQGLPDSVLVKFPGTLYQRMLARTTPCGGEPGKTYLWPRDLDGKRSPFWNRMKTTKGLIRTDLWTTPDPNRQVTINAEALPEPITAEEMVGFDTQSHQQKKWEDEDDYPFFRDIYDREQWVKEDNTYEDRPSYRLETQEELEQRIANYIPEPTDHSTLPSNPKFLSRVVAYDLPIGFCQSHQDKAFWHELNRVADWRIAGADSYFVTGTPNIPPMPALIDTETYGDLQKQREQTAALWNTRGSKERVLA
jgi:pimeloyl-ACP methyl ester carboxylesterase